MDSSFEIIKTFIKSIDFKSFDSSEMYYNAIATTNFAVNINVESKMCQEKSFYLVELYINLIAKTDELVETSLKLIYSVMVKIADYEESNRIKHIVQVDVPRSQYNYIRALIWNITLAAGIPPIMLTDNHFALCQSNEVMCCSEADQGCGEEEIVNYKYILNNIEATKEGSVFIKTFKQASDNDMSVYEDLSLYKYYYRFLRPIEYNHPDFLQCDDSFWPMLFQLLFAEAEDVKIVDGKNVLPEIEFTYSQYENELISALSLDELKELALSLITEALTETAVTMFRINIDDEYAERMYDDRPVIKEELFALYNCDIRYVPEDIVLFVENIYDKIKNCELQTIKFRF